MSHLFSPFKLRSVELRNRVGISPMCQYSAVEGMAKGWHFAHYGSRAAGGAGLVLIEATAVEPRGRITPLDLGIWTDAHAAALGKIAAFISAQGAVPGIQLGHAGRKASCAPPWDGGRQLSDAEGGWRPVGPGRVPFGGGLSRVPWELSEAEIADITAAFAAAARRAAAVGFKWLELHAAHGYLLQSFCSPLTNQRADTYGGTFKNRIRFLMEVVRASREAWPDELPLAVRVSATEWVDGGWSVEDSIALARRLKPKGVDLLDVSSGGNLPDAPIPSHNPGYQTPFAERLRREVEIPVAAVGNITTATLAEDIVASGKADLVLIGRKSLAEPYWPLKASAELGGSPAWPPQYARAAL
ncbi:MAG: NADH:flavin oxidoreductase/NADH oxidase [Opitutaceae bacterium]|jgi:2,4-dienoyl-CoA reductase-like NADH-dependent reductase (Old Yellow Enzyme family)|nr:NADH:flavin oxidoreductase/NADH oxidase [Opitutaceae bacterium]